MALILVQSCESADGLVFTRFSGEDSHSSFRLRAIYFRFWIVAGTPASDFAKKELDYPPKRYAQSRAQPLSGDGHEKM
ncbi:hypothetical protein [Fulvitalea axinellae]|uniref:hypothetical protein n=1 Tax=Fulvitalea axinellae TaxID=1182444 RepID=UPI0030CA4B0D